MQIVKSQRSATHRRSAPSGSLCDASRTPALGLCRYAAQPADSSNRLLIMMLLFVGTCTIVASPALGQLGSTDSRPAGSASTESNPANGSAAEQSGTSAGSSLGLIRALEEASVRAIARAEAAVVAIARVPRQRATNDRRGLDPLRIQPMTPFADPLNDPDFVPTHFASGVVLDQNGYIVTCAHALGDPEQNDYYVWLQGKGYAAKVAGMPAQIYAADPFSDLAVLKISADNLQPITLAPGDRIRKGSFVFALGNAHAVARDGQATASFGIVANLYRKAPLSGGDNATAGPETIHEFGTLIQTDARMGLGSSGGALIDLDGRMIGLTTALAAHSGYEQTAGYAIACDELFRRVVATLKLGRLPEFGFLGIQPDEVRPADKRRGVSGARVSVVLPGFPGDAAGLKSDDIIVQVDENSVHNRSDLFRELSAAQAGQEVELLVHRQRPGSRQPSVVRLIATVSKKHVSTSRPSFALHAPPPWRGLQVEYTTAVPSDQIRGRIPSLIREPLAIAVLSVDPNSAAWEAGLRPGYQIVNVDGQAVQTPDQFRSLVESSDGDVSLEVVQPDGRGRRLVVGPQ